MKTKNFKGTWTHDVSNRCHVYKLSYRLFNFLLEMIWSYSPSMINNIEYFFFIDGFLFRLMTRVQMCVAALAYRSAVYACVIRATSARTVSVRRIVEVGLTRSAAAVRSTTLPGSFALDTAPVFAIPASARSCRTPPR